jgi:hypothetical protein
LPVENRCKTNRRCRGGSVPLLTGVEVVWRDEGAPPDLDAGVFNL